MKIRLFRNEINITAFALVGIIVFIAVLFVFGLLGHEIVVENEDWFDTRVFSFFDSKTPAYLIPFFRVITFFGSIPFLVPAYVAVVLFLIYKKKKSEALCVAIIGIATSILVFSLKSIYGRDRPSSPMFARATNYSFPSGHSLSSLVFCGVLISLVWLSTFGKIWKIIIAVLLVLLTLLIGVSRIVLRYHFASDVLAGFCVGIACMILFFWLMKNLRVKRSGKK